MTLFRGTLLRTLSFPKCCVPLRHAKAMSRIERDLKTGPVYLPNFPGLFEWPRESKFISRHLFLLYILGVTLIFAAAPSRGSRALSTDADGVTAEEKVATPYGLNARASTSDPLPNLEPPKAPISSDSMSAAEDIVGNGTWGCAPIAI